MTIYKHVEEQLRSFARTHRRMTADNSKQGKEAKLLPHLLLVVRKPEETLRELNRGGQQSLGRVCSM